MASLSSPRAQCRGSGAHGLTSAKVRSVCREGACADEEDTEEHGSVGTLGRASRGRGERGWSSAISAAPALLSLRTFQPEMRPWGG